eukprot:TRINITY_DN16667_c0_g1_i1.p1 TRINITY_DN16667_c0_g1~~TRINITY_DN16667_c0_g1_i1.p1  ORF type:complete len:163 (-),score=31.09 TRINITY_DN16667_c0_g1_i1:294-782(-)
MTARGECQEVNLCGRQPTDGRQPGSMGNGDKPLNREENPDAIVVLYVEDDMMMQMALKAVLSGQSHIQLEVASDEDDALAYLEENDCLPDLVLMDVDLGGITGGEVIEMMREDVGDRLTFLLCTGLSTQEAEEAASDAKAQGYICKPYTEDQVVAMITKHVP